MLDGGKEGAVKGGEEAFYTACGARVCGGKGWACEECMLSNKR